MIHSRSEYLNLLRELIRAQYRLKDKSTFLGIAWSLLHPLMLLGIIYLLFSARIGQNIEHYGIFLLIGLVHFTYFSTATTASMRVLVAMHQLTADAIFPKELLVMANVFMYAIELLASFAVCLLIAYASGIEVTVYWLLLPLVMLIQVVFVLWVSFLLSCTFIFVQDLQHFYQVFLRILLFVTPIFYGIDFLGHGVARDLVALNPLAALIDFSRSLVIDAAVPSLSLAGLWVLFHAIMLVFSLGIFRRLEPTFAEKV